MLAKPIDPKTIAKLSHVSGREWTGYLLPREIIAIAEARAILTDHYRKEVLRARERLKKGDAMPLHFYFGIHSGSTLSKALAKRVPKTHEKA